MKSNIETYLTIEKARELFEMRGPDVVWRVSRRNGAIPSGSIAGYLKQVRNAKYRVINILCEDGNVHMVGAHQIAFALHHGHWADKEIDHADTDGLNNTPDNLREATPAENGYNVKCRSNTGVKGVSFSSVRNSVRPYQAMLRAEGKIVFSKEFATLEEATVAIRAARELHHGEFCNHG